LIRDGVVYGHWHWTRLGRTDAEWRLLLYVLAELHEWQIVEGGQATYLDLGYRTADGQIPAWKLLSHKLISDLMAEAQGD
jgi:hypothetical protein